jgi:hypothetical protein
MRIKNAQHVSSSVKVVDNRRYMSNQAGNLLAFKVLLFGDNRSSRRLGMVREIFVQLEPA